MFLNEIILSHIALFSDSGFFSGRLTGPKIHMPVLQEGVNVLFFPPSLRFSE